jgi:hypothetical protein
MTVVGYDTDNPFSTAPAAESADQQRPPVDDEAMRRLRTPFATLPAPRKPNPPAAVAPGRDGPPGEHPERRTPGGRGRD